jgi:hypothetical protein
MSAKGAAIFALVVCILSAVATLLFVCIHFPHGWWCLLIIPPLIAAFVIPAICYGYNELDDNLLVEAGMERAQFENCRMLAWSISGVLVLVAYSVPLLVWYNSGGTFRYTGALAMIASLTCVLWAFVLWRRVFIGQ